MADNVAITAGAGTSIATDQIGSDHYQWIKQKVGVADTAADIVLTTVNDAFTLPDGDALAALDTVSDHDTAASSTVMSWAIAAGAGVLRRVRIFHTDFDNPATFRLWLFDTTFTPNSGNNDAFSEVLATAIGYVDVVVNNQGTDVAVGWTNCDIPFVGANLYGMIQTLAAWDPGTTETIDVDLYYLPG